MRDLMFDRPCAWMICSSTTRDILCQGKPHPKIGQIGDVCHTWWRGVHTQRRETALELGPEDEWQRHTHPRWQETLVYARARGWRLQVHSGHAFGTLRCEQGKCEIKIFSTGKGAESVALTARKVVDRCVHGSSTPDLLAAVDDRLAKAENLIIVAEAMCARDKAAAAVAVLEDVDALMTGGAVWDEFSRLVDEIEMRTAVIDDALAQAGLGAPATPTAVIDSAAQHVGVARRELAKGPTLAREVKERTKKCSELAERIRDVRKALNG
ncbi:hypothetical protein IU459_08165 [Nocardia amamiensis]|uniref:Uncharacterized protein n=1 Tax=Nocardia amamiensis TaxID=404578 RepID=A0ABS0CLP8_9NOCA|nr:hypothetical protein [Nocardia amamiensis]MBF6297517.1 hypothetical protein [Nocardia amamiensis]